MQEKYIEQKLVATVKSMGGIAPKFVSPGIDGMPDQLYYFPWEESPLSNVRQQVKRCVLYRI